jgi:hypothetical protein
MIVTAKEKKSTDRAINEWFPRIIPKDLQTLATVLLPTGTTLKKMCK